MENEYSKASGAKKLYYFTNPNLLSVGKILVPEGTTNMIDMQDPR